MSDFKCNAGAVVARKSFGGGTQKHVMRTLVDLTQADGRITATIPEIAAAAEVSDRTVQTHLKAFVAKGLVRHVGEVGIYGRKHNVYSVDLSALKRLPDTDFHRSSKITGEGNSPRKMPHRVKEAPPTGEPIAVSPVKEIHPLNVENISLPLEEDHILSDQCERDPLAAVVVKADWSARLEQALERAGKAINAASPGLRHYADLRRLCEPAKGIPCDWEHDVLPAIDKVSASFLRSGKTLRAWTLIEEHAVANRDNRLRGLAEPQSELFSDAAGADNVEHFDVERTRQDHRKPQGGKRGSGGRNPVSPFDGVRELINRAREDERRQRNDGMDQPHMRYIGGA